MFKGVFTGLLSSRCSPSCFKLLSLPVLSSPRELNLQKILNTSGFESLDIVDVDCTLTARISWHLLLLVGL
jgi:hypothetical protein